MSEGSDLNEFWYLEGPRVSELLFQIPTGIKPLIFLLDQSIDP